MTEQEFVEFCRNNKWLGFVDAWRLFKVAAEFDIRKAREIWRDHYSPPSYEEVRKRLINTGVVTWDEMTVEEQAEVKADIRGWERVSVREFQATRKD